MPLTAMVFFAVCACHWTLADHGDRPHDNRKILCSSGCHRAGELIDCNVLNVLEDHLTCVRLQATLGR
jgi:hypothetical protein